MFLLNHEIPNTSAKARKPTTCTPTQTKLTTPKNTMVFDKRKMMCVVAKALHTCVSHDTYITVCIVENICEEFTTHHALIFV